MANVPTYQNQVDMMPMPKVAYDADMGALMSGAAAAEGMGNVGRAMQRDLSGGLMDASNVAFHIQAQNDALAAKNALNQAQQNYDNYFNNEVLSKKGVDAANVYRDGVSKMSDIGRQSMKELSPHQQFLFSQMWQDQQRIGGDQLGKYQIAQTQKGNLDASEALIATNKQMAIGDPAHADDYFKRLDTALVSSCRQQGLPQEVYDLRKSDLNSQIRKGIVDSYLAQDNVTAAQQYFDAHQNEMLPEYKTAIEDKLKKSVDHVFSSNAADTEFNAIRPGLHPYGDNLADKMQSGLDDIEKKYADDPRYENIRQLFKVRCSDFGSTCNAHKQNAIKTVTLGIMTAPSDTDAANIAAKETDPIIAELAQKALQNRMARTATAAREMNAQQNAYLNSPSGQAAQYQALDRLKTAMYTGSIDIGGTSMQLNNSDDVAVACSQLGLDKSFQTKAQDFYAKKDSRVNPVEVNRIMQSFGYGTAKGKQGTDVVPGITEQLQLMLPANKTPDDQWLKQNISRLLMDKISQPSFGNSFWWGVRAGLGYGTSDPAFSVQTLGEATQNSTTAKNAPDLYMTNSDMLARYQARRTDMQNAGRLPGWMKPSPGPETLERFAMLTGFYRDQQSGVFKPYGASQQQEMK